MISPIFEVPPLALIRGFPRIIFNPTECNLLFFAANHLNSRRICYYSYLDSDIFIIRAEVSKSADFLLNPRRLSESGTLLLTGGSLEFSNYRSKGILWWNQKFFLVPSEFFNYLRFICFFAFLLYDSYLRAISIII